MINSNILNLTRTNVWSNELKQILLDELTGQGHVRWLPFEGGNTTLNIPSVGEGTVRNYVEDTPVVYDSLDTGNFTFSITEYVQSGNYITEKARQDLFYAAQLEASFVPKQARAIAERVETDIYKLAGASASGGQTAGSANQINGADHRWVAQGSVLASTEYPMSPKDFSKALFSLKKANVPGTGLIAIVDPSVEYSINNSVNLVQASASSGAPMWGDLLTSGIGSGPRFIRNIFGFDVYVSNYLAPGGAAGGTTSTTAVSETINSIASGTNAVCNVFMSAADQMLLPFIGSWGQMPKVDGEYNKDFQREEYVTTCRYGLKVYRPENLIVVLSSTAVIL
jgi:hypothetical protein